MRRRYDPVDPLRHFFSSLLVENKAEAKLESKLREWADEP
jgi:hypothetical protein